MKHTRSRALFPAKTSAGKLFKSLTSLSWVFLLAISANAQSLPGPISSQPTKTAWDVWNQLTESVLLKDGVKTEVEKSNGGTLSFGGEKEASSSILTRVMGPNQDAFARYVRDLAPEGREKFLREFLSGWLSGRYRNKAVMDSDGKVVTIDLTELTSSRVKSASTDELQKSFDLWLERAGDRSFSFINPQTRRKIFNADFPGLSSDKAFKNYFKQVLQFSHWVPHYGDAQKYVLNAHNTGPGWELNFIPQNSYGEFEKMIVWFQETLATEGNLFEAPGHQWLVYPKPAELSREEQKKIGVKMGEIYKNIQAYIYLRGIEGRSGIEIASHKSIHSDDSFISYHSTSRGVIRTQDERFEASNGQPAFNLEQRAGTKNSEMRRLIQKVIISRYAALEFEDLADPSSWILIDGAAHSEKAIIERFGVTRFELSAFKKNVQGAEVTRRNSTRSLSMEGIVPFWRWENAPYLSPAKKAQLRRLTRSFIQTVAGMKSPSLFEIQSAMQTWSAASALSHDIEAYLRPKPPAILRNHDASYYSVRSDAPVDVNRIDLGLEYTARFPVESQNAYTERLLRDGRRGWLGSEYDLTQAERVAVIKKMAADLGEELNGKPVPVKVASGGDHGHSLVIQFEVKDRQGRKWKVEWDGVGRDYDAEGKIIPGSERGGHIEVVTPKFQPTHEETQAVFRAFEKQSLIPSIRMGGGHINIDLAAFDGKPRELARFIATFLKNRSVVSMLFQHPGRLASAEPHDVDEAFVRKLENFTGSEAELKQLLYNEHFFNTRLGRKSRYVQLDLSAYFQDVIPAEYIHADFDIKNQVWRKSFNVEPKIRKMEFRLFNAPRDVFEAELQKKLVRAMLNQALNESAPTAGKLQAIEYEKLAKNPELALRQFKETMTSFGLQPGEYRVFLLEGLAQTRQWMGREAYLPYERKMAAFPKMSGWGSAVAPRPADQALSAASRVWSGVDPELKALEAAELKRLTRLQLETIREEMGPGKLRPGTLNRKFGDAPLDKYLGVNEILGLPTNQGLQIAQLQLRSGGLKLTDPDYLELINQLKARPEFGLTLGQEFSSSASSEYRLWLAGLLAPDFRIEADTIGALIAMATDSSPGVRARALALLQKVNVELILSAVDSIGGRYETRAIDLQGLGDLFRLMDSKLKGTEISVIQSSALVRSLNRFMSEARFAPVAPEAALVLRHVRAKDREHLAEQVLKGTAGKGVRRSLVAILNPEPSSAARIILDGLSTDPDPVIQRQAKARLAAQDAAIFSLQPSGLDGLDTGARIRVLYFKARSDQKLFENQSWKETQANIRLSNDFADAIGLEYERGLTRGYDNPVYRRWLVQELLTVEKIEILGMKMLLDSDAALREKGRVWSRSLSEQDFFRGINEIVDNGNWPVGSEFSDLTDEVLSRLPAENANYQYHLKDMVWGAIKQSVDQRHFPVIHKLLARLDDETLRMVFNNLSNLEKSKLALVMPIFQVNPTAVTVRFWINSIDYGDDAIQLESKRALVSTELPDDLLTLDLVKRVKELLKDPDPAIRAGAVRLIGKYEQKIRQLTPIGMQSLSMREQFRAVYENLLQLGTSEGSEPWKQALATLKESSDARREVQQILSEVQYGGDEGQRARAFRRWLVQEWLVANPEATSNREDFSRIRSLLLFSRDPELRSLGFQELLKARTLEELMSDLDNARQSSELQPRLELLEALSQVREELVQDGWPQLAMHAVEALGQVESDASSRMRLLALQLLKKVPDSQAVVTMDSIVSNADNRRNPLIKRLAVLALRGRNFPEAQAFVASLAQDPDPVVRRLVAEGPAGACAENLRPESFPE